MLVSTDFICKTEGHDCVVVKGVVALYRVTVPGQGIFNNYSTTLARVGHINYPFGAKIS